MKNYEIFLIRHGSTPLPYPNVGKVYTSPHKSCAKAAQLIYPTQPLNTAATLRKRDDGETNEEFAVRCIAGLNRVFADLTSSDTAKAALITHDEIIVTLMAGCGLPKYPPTEFILKPGEGWLINMTAYLWQKGYAFEIAGKLSL
jgi:hypothetical protein